MVHNFQLAPYMTPDDTRIYTRIKL